MALEPIARQPRHLVQRSRFFEQVRCSGHDQKPLFAAKLRERFPVQLNDLVVVFSDNQQRGSLNARQGRTGEVGATASRDDRTSVRKADAASAAAAPVLAPK